MTKRYLIPENHLPEDDICIPVHIPNDDLYLYAFMGALAHMGKWIAWNDGGDGRAKEVADRWKQAEIATRMAWEAGECGLMIRQNPENKCELQQSTDGETWATWAILSDCAGAPTQTDPPFPPGTSGSKDDSAANIAQFLADLMCIIATGVNDGLSDAAIRQQAIAYWQAYLPGSVVIETINAMIAEAQGASAGDLAEWCGGGWPQDLYDGVICDGVVGGDGTGGAWLDDLADKIDGWLTGAAESVTNALNAAANILGIGQLNFAAGAAGAGGGAGFGPPGCPVDQLKMNWTDDYDLVIKTLTWASGYDGAFGNPAGSWRRECLLVGNQWVGAINIKYHLAGHVDTLNFEGLWDSNLPADRLSYDRVALLDAADAVIWQHNVNNTNPARNVWLQRSFSPNVDVPAGGSILFVWGLVSTGADICEVNEWDAAIDNIVINGSGLYSHA